MRIYYVGLANPVIAEIKGGVKGGTAEEIYESLISDISRFELELLPDWYEQKQQAQSNLAVETPK